MSPYPYFSAGCGRCNLEVLPSSTDRRTFARGSRTRFADAHMALQRLFPTLVYRGRLKQAGWQTFNNRLLQECRQLRLDDAGGRRWSAKNYPGGYTSYNSVNRMHQVSPTFAELERRLRRHVRSFAA